MNCAVCGREASSVSLIKLVGGYYAADMCVLCLNEFNEYSANLDALIHLEEIFSQQIYISMLSHTVAPTQGEVERLAKLEKLCLHDLFAISKEWVESRKKAKDARWEK